MMFVVVGPGGLLSLERRAPSGLLALGGLLSPRRRFPVGLCRTVAVVLENCGGLLARSWRIPGARVQKHGGLRSGPNLA